MGHVYLILKIKNQGKNMVTGLNQIQEYISDLYAMQ